MIIGPLIPMMLEAGDLFGECRDGFFTDRSRWPTLPCCEIAAATSRLPPWGG